MSYRKSGLAVAGETMAEYRYPGDMVLDPVCGAGTMAVAALKLGRRFIVVDLSPIAVDIAWERVQEVIKSGDYVHTRLRNGERSAIYRIDATEWEQGGIRFNLPAWDNGQSYVVQGDALTVMRTMPDCFVSLVYMDPPFGTGRTFSGTISKGKHKGTKVSFSDNWKWDDTAEARLAELAEMPPERATLAKTGESGIDLAVDTIRLVKRMDPKLASYLVWTALLIVEARRVMGSTEWVPRYPLLGE